MIANFQNVNEKVSTGAQPSLKDFNDLKRDNFQVIVNLSPESTPNYLNNEAEIVHEAGMDYVHIPIDCSTLKDEHYKDFETVIEKIKDKKIFIHCGGNIKSSGFYYIYQIKKEGVTKQNAIIKLNELKVHDQKWYDYFEKMGC